MVRSNWLLLSVLLALMLGLAGVAAGQDADGDGVIDPCDLCPGTPLSHIVDANGCTIATYTWVGGTTGILNWNDPVNWDPCNVGSWGDPCNIPDRDNESALIDDVLTGDRTIIAASLDDPNVLKLSHFSWFTHGGSVDKIKLATDLWVNGGYRETYPHYLANTSGDETKMVLDLAGYDMIRAPWGYKVPAMTIMDSSASGSSVTFIGLDIRETNFTIEPEVTVRLDDGTLQIPSSSLPNLTVIGIIPVNAINELAGKLVPGTIIGDVTIEYGQLQANIGRLRIQGNVIIENEPNAGLLCLGATTGFDLQGDWIDHNTINDDGAGGLQHYDRGLFHFSGKDPCGQIVDVWRESHISLVVDPCSHVVLGNDYYGPARSIPGSNLQTRVNGFGGILDVGEYDLTVTDFVVQNEIDSAYAPTLRFTAGTNSGSITVLGNSAQNPGTTGLQIKTFKLEIRDGGGWSHGQDFILIDYDEQGTEFIAPDPRLVSITFPNDWVHSGLVHDTENKVIYLKEFGLKMPKCGDGEHPAPGGDASGDCYVNETDLELVLLDWLKCTHPLVAGCIQLRPSPEEMEPNTLYMKHWPGATPPDIDGDLDEPAWTGSDPCWMDLTRAYYNDACDVVSAKYAVYWGGDATDPCMLIYVAVIVDDRDHVLEGATDWNSSDRIEIYIEGDPNTGDPNSGDEWGANSELKRFDKAQQYATGRKGSGGFPWYNGVWRVFGNGTPIQGLGTPSPAGFKSECMIKNTTELHYEIQVKAWVWYAGNYGGVSEARRLEPGMQVGFDIIAGSRYGSVPEPTYWPPQAEDPCDPNSQDPNWVAYNADYGMVSANLATLKFIYAENFQRWELKNYDGTNVPPECGDWGILVGDIYKDDGRCEVGLDDFALLSNDWMDCTDPCAPCGYNPF